MKLEELKENWESLGAEDPYWAVLSDPAKINNKWDLNVFYRTGEELLNSVVDKLDVNKQIKFGQVLDFGCGPGRITQALAKRSKSTVGVDISSTMIEKAKAYNKFPDSCRYLVNSKSDLSQLHSDSFDFVFSYITLQHVKPEYSRKYIQDFIRVTKPGGHIFFNLPTKPPLFFRMMKTIIGAWGINHIRRLYYKKSSVIEMHSIAENDVSAIAQSSGSEIITITPDERIGMGWESRFYFLRKL